jgi:hypothetical protein
MSFESVFRSHRDMRGWLQKGATRFEKKILPPFRQQFALVNEDGNLGESEKSEYVAEILLDHVAAGGARVSAI